MLNRFFGKEKMAKHAKLKSDNPATLFKENVDYLILEEGIDVRSQHDFFSLRSNLLKDKENFITLCKEAKQNVSLLFDPQTPAKTIKRLLVLLAAIDSIPIYRTLQRYAELDTPLKPWAVIAAQQSRMLISTSLMNNNAGVFISSGLGGAKSKLRYFCVFPYNKTKILEQYQEELLYNELTYSIKRAEGEVERFTIKPYYITATILLPLRSDIKEIFGEIVAECNTYGDFLNEKVIITNVKELTDSEIQNHMG
ncbi:MAG: hypothetical protein J6K74_04320 [Marinifilaceae bacterium]|nr:hypothetical protein [Marinifilaceae bacterium]